MWKGDHDENNIIINNKNVKRGPWRKQYGLNNNVAKRGGGGWRKQYDPKQQGCEKGVMTKTIWPKQQGCEKGTWRKQYNHKQECEKGTMTKTV